MVAARDGAVSHSEDLQDCVALIDRGRVHIEVVAFVRVYLLPVEGALDRDEPIAQRRGSLERERVRGLLHLGLRVTRERFVPSFEEEHALVDRRAVVIPRCVAYARRGAALQVKEKTRAT